MMSSLQLTELSVGGILVLWGSFFVFYREYCEAFLRKLLRSPKANTLLFLAALIWFLGHILTLGESDMGNYKYLIFAFFLAIGITALRKIRDFLSVRGLAILALLISNELLKITHMEPYGSRLVLVTFVYGMTIAGMILGAWPYKGRDWIDFIFRKPEYAYYFGIFFMSYGVLTASTIFW